MLGVTMRNRRRTVLLIAALAASFAGSVQALAADGPAIAAAADLNASLPEVAALFTRQSGKTVRLIFGSSGNFAQQILNGAPFQLYLSADEAYVNKLAAAGKTEGNGALYAIGRIGLFVPIGSPLKLDATLMDLGIAASDGRLQKFAIANPQHAPYGRAAQQALQNARVWTAVKLRLVLGENVAQATQFATSGSAQGGIIPLSLALTPAVKAAGAFILIDASAHEPLRQRMVLIKGASPTAREFYAFLKSPPALAIFKRYGFIVPGKAN